MVGALLPSSFFSARLAFLEGVSAAFTPTMALASSWTFDAVAHGQGRRSMETNSSVCTKPRCDRAAGSK